MVDTIDSRIVERDRVWREKSVLRAVYHHLYDQMRAACVPGATLELGGGSGLFKTVAPETITTDIIPSSALDVVADAQHLPFAAGHFANIVMFDVLHHVEFPRIFFAEALRVLKPGGRLVMMEPAITPLSWAFYHFLHEEAVDLSADPLVEGHPSPGRDPFTANQAIPTLLMGRYRLQLAAAFPDLRLRRCMWMSLLAYPLSGGFKPWSAIPRWLVGPLLWVEDLLAPFVGRLAGFRMLIVFEKIG